MSDSQRKQWQEVALGDIVQRLVNGGTPPTEVSAFWEGDIPWITGADFTSSGIGEFRRFISNSAVAQTSTSVIQKGNLLLVTRTGVGKLAIAPCDLAISQDITGVYPNEELVDVEFLYYCMRAGVEDLKKLNQGTSINGIVRKDLIGYRIFLPPISQQRRIAEILTTLDETIEHTEALIAKTQQIKAGLMHDLFTRGVMPDGRLRPSREEASELYKESVLGWIPREWTVSALSEVVPRAVYGISDSLDSASGIPVLRMNNIREGEADLSNLKFSESSLARALLLRPGDVLFNRTNSIEHVGRTGIWRGELPEASFASYLVRLDADPNYLRAEFLNAWLNWDLTQIRIRRFATPGVHQVNINPTNLRRIAIALPQRLEEQDSVVDLLQSNAEVLCRYSEQESKLQSLKVGLMQKLLNDRFCFSSLENQVAAIDAPTGFKATLQS